MLLQNYDNIDFQGLAPIVRDFYVFINTKENIGIAEANVFCGLADKAIIFSTEENLNSYLLEESTSQLEKAGADIKGVIISDYVYDDSELDDLFGGK